MGVFSLPRLNGYNKLARYKHKNNKRVEGNFMDFSNRGSQLNNSSPTHDLNLNKPNNSLTSKMHSKGKSNNKWYRVIQSVLVLCVTVVIIGLLVFLAISDWSNSAESSYVQTNKLQAVFLNTGQVYFGNIKTINNNFLVLTNIFYLETSGSGSSTSGTSTSSSSSNSSNGTVTLVKLGCEIHAPLDWMYINKTSVTFWENLSPSGQVSKAVATWEKENPNGQKCSDQSTAGTSGQNTAQNATDNTGTTTSTNATTTGSSTSTSK